MTALTDRQAEILDDQIRDFNKDNDRNPDRGELLELLAERERDELEHGGDFDLGMEFGQLFDHFRAASDTDPADEAMAALEERAEERATSRPTTQADRLADAIETALEAIEALAIELHNTHTDAARRFNAYHLADLEGTAADWLGGPYLVDALRELQADADAGTGADDDR